MIYLIIKLLQLSTSSLDFYELFSLFGPVCVSLVLCISRFSRNRDRSPFASASVDFFDLSFSSVDIFNNHSLLLPRYRANCRQTPRNWLFSWKVSINFCKIKSETNNQITITIELPHHKSIKAKMNLKKKLYQIGIEMIWSFWVLHSIDEA